MRCRGATRASRRTRARQVQTYPRLRAARKLPTHPQFIVGARAKNPDALLSFGWPSSFFCAAASFFTAASFLGAGKILVFLSTLTIVFPNADSSEQGQWCPQFRSTLSRQKRNLKTIETQIQDVQAFNWEDRHVEGSKRQ